MIEMIYGNSHLDPELLSAYHDGEVSEKERALVEEHLKTCEVCRRELEALAWTATLFKRLPTVTPPKTFYITEAMVAPEQQPARRLWGRWQQLLGSVAAIAALLLCVLLVRLPTDRAAEPSIAVRQEAPVEEAAPADAEESIGALAVEEEVVEEEVVEEEVEAEIAMVEEAAAPAEALEADEAAVDLPEEEMGDAAAADVVEEEERFGITAEEEPLEEVAPLVEEEAEVVEEEAAVASEALEADAPVEETLGDEIQEVPAAEDTAEAVEEEPGFGVTAEEPLVEQAAPPADEEAIEAIPEAEPAREAPLQRALPFLVLALLLLLVAGGLVWRRRVG